MTGELSTIPGEIFTVILVPIGKHPALDASIVDTMFVPIRTMRVTVNQRGTAMLAQEVFNGGGRGIHRLHGFGAFGVLAL